MNNYKVIFHIDENSKFKLLLANLNNLIQSMDQEPITIEVLANSEAVKLFVLNDINEVEHTNVQNLINKGVIFSLCNNSLRSNKIDPSLLIQNAYLTRFSPRIRQYSSGLLISWKNVSLVKSTSSLSLVEIPM